MLLVAEFGRNSRKRTHRALLPTNQHVIVHTIYLCMPRSPTLVKPWWHNLGHEASKSGTTEEVYFHALRMLFQQWKEEVDGRFRSWSCSAVQVEMDVQCERLIRGESSMNRVNLEQLISHMYNLLSVCLTYQLMLLLSDIK